MKCEQCGRRRDPSELRAVTFHKQTGHAGPAGEPTEIATRRVCPACAVERGATEKSIVRAVLFVLGGLVLLRLLVAWLG